METPETLAVIAVLPGVQRIRPALDIARMAEMVGAWPPARAAGGLAQ